MGRVRIHYPASTGDAHEVGDIQTSVRYLEMESGGEWLLCDGRLIREAEYPELCETLPIEFGFAPQLAVIPKPSALSALGIYSSRCRANDDTLVVGYGDSYNLAFALYALPDMSLKYVSPIVRPEGDPDQIIAVSADRIYVLNVLDSSNGKLYVLDNNGRLLRTADFSENNVFYYSVNRTAAVINDIFYFTSYFNKKLCSIDASGKQMSIALGGGQGIDGISLATSDGKLYCSLNGKVYSINTSTGALTEWAVPAGINDVVRLDQDQNFIYLYGTNGNRLWVTDSMDKGFGDPIVLLDTSGITSCPSMRADRKVVFYAYSQYASITKYYISAYNAISSRFYAFYGGGDSGFNLFNGRYAMTFRNKEMYFGTITGQRALPSDTTATAPTMYIKSR